jgi:hypothetical protein
MLMRRRSDLQSRYVSVTDTGAGFELTFNPSQALTLGLLQREQEAHRRFAKIAKRAGAVKSRSKEGTSKAIIASFDRSQVQAALVSLDAELDRLKRMKLYPSMVEELLGISGIERLRWTKDGRLKTSGSGSFTNGPQVIHFPLYHPDMIVELAKNPAEIASWRERDLANCAS